MNVREKLVELLESARYWGSNTSEEIADSLIAHGVTVSEWISVEDRLPENGGRFLVRGSRGGIYTAEFRKIGNFGGEYPHWHKLNSKSHYCEPTHWMPLPEPPKEDKT